MGHTTLCHAAALLVLSACASSSKHVPTPKYPPVESSELGTMHNVSVSEGVWFGGAPSLADLDLARRRGVERIIALEEPGSLDFDLAEACSTMSLECHELMLLAGGAIPEPVVDRVVSLLGQEPRRKTLMFCGDGSRSAMLFAVHRTVNVGVPVEDALVEARRSGMRPGAAEEFVRTQVTRYSASAGE